MPYGTFVYEVEKHEIVDPETVEIVENVGYERLVLTACHPLYSAAQRYAQFAKLTDVELGPLSLRPPEWAADDATRGLDPPCTTPSTPSALWRPCGNRPSGRS